MSDSTQVDTISESIWDYPRPPRIEPSERRVRVLFNGQTVADSTRAVRVLETGLPPTWYIPREDARADLLRPAAGHSVCEWKGIASYWTLVTGGRESEKAAWSYEEPVSAFESIRGHLAFYAGRVDACFVDDEQVIPQTGAFYGGWVTRDVAT